jgi:hypothetical protein
MLRRIRGVLLVAAISAIAAFSAGTASARTADGIVSSGNCSFSWTSTGLSATCVVNGVTYSCTFQKTGIGTYALSCTTNTTPPQTLNCTFSLFPRPTATCIKE